MYKKKDKAEKIKRKCTCDSFWCRQTRAAGGESSLCVALEDQPVRPAIKETQIYEAMGDVEMVVVEEVEYVSD